MVLKKCSLRKALKLIGGTDIKLSKGHMYESGFFKLNNQLYYAVVSDVHCNGKYITIRTAAHNKDYKGGTNEWWVDEKIKELGYRFNPQTLKRL